MSLGSQERSDSYHGFLMEAIVNPCQISRFLSFCECPICMPQAVLFQSHGQGFSINVRNMLSRCGPRGSLVSYASLQIIELLSGFWNVDILFESLLLFLLILPGAEERAQKEAAEKEQELLRQKQKEQQEYMEAQEKSHKENLEQLRRKLEQEREQDIKDHDMMLKKLMKVGVFILMVVLVPQAVGESCQPGHMNNKIIIYYCKAVPPPPRLLYSL